MPKTRSNILSDSESDGSSDSSSEVSEISSSDEELDDDVNDFNSDVEEEPEDIPLIGWKQISPNKPIDASRFPFTGKPGLTIPVDAKWTELDYVKLFLDESIVSLIVQETNRYAEKYIDKNYPRESQRKKFGWYPLTVDEYWSFTGILIYQAIIVKPQQRWYWTKNKMFQTPFAKDIMTMKRFEKIMKFMHFCNNENYNASKHQCPKLHKIWSIYQAMISNFEKLYIPERDVSIDESLMPSKHHLSFRQFIPNKRARFGIKFFQLCESKSGYIVKSIIYTGKDTQKNKDCEDYGIAASIVLELGQNLFHQGYCFIMDNYYNSPRLCELLISKKTDVFGTVRSNRKGLPENFSKIKLKKDEAVCWQKKGVVVLKWHDKKDVSVISTCHDVSFEEITPKHGQKKRKPKIVLDYNKNMGGVDVADQIMGTYSLMRKQQKKFYKKIYRHLLDQCLLNAYVLFKKYKNQHVQHLSFLVKVIEEIVSSHVKNLPVTASNRGRPRIERSLYGDTTPTRLLGRHFPKLVPSTENKVGPTRRCTVCCSKKENGKKIRKETRYYCVECNVGLCAAPCFEIYHTKEEY